MDDICSMKNAMNRSLELWVGQGAAALRFFFFFFIYLFFQVIGIQLIYTVNE